MHCGNSVEQFMLTGTTALQQWTEDLKLLRVG